MTSTPPGPGLQEHRPVPGSRGHAAARQAGDEPGRQPGCDLMHPGPYDTADEAAAAARAVIPPRDGRAVLTRAQQKNLLARIIDGTGIRTGRHDNRILDWLCGCDDATVAVIAGLLLRAAAALRPGSRYEWGVQYDGRRIELCHDRDEAEDAAAEAAEADPGSPARVVCRLVGPWRPAGDNTRTPEETVNTVPGAPATAPGPDQDQTASRARQARPLPGP